VNIGIIQRVLQNLLKEGISIKNLPVILEAVADFAGATKNPDDLSEQVRRRLGTYFVAQFESRPGIIQAITLDPRLEHLLGTRVQRTQFEIGLSLDPNLAHHMLGELTRRSNEMVEAGLTPIIMTTAEARLAFKRFFETSLPRLVVLSYHELPPQTEIQNFAIIQLPHSNTPAAPAMAAA
jgi:flagellar biosynthesis protein FlhA